MSKCINPRCEYLIHTDFKNNGGKHCCKLCKNTGDGHGPLCQKLGVFRPYLKFHSELDASALEASDASDASDSSEANSSSSETSNLRVKRSWFKANELASIYKFPKPEGHKVIGVISLGGGLFGNVDTNGVLTDGDVQHYWGNVCKINPVNFPKVIVIPIDGAKNKPKMNDGSATIENTMDVETIGACCPSSDTTIIIYIGKNNASSFSNLILHATTTPKVINGISYKPTILSISWGMAEVLTTSTALTATNLAMRNATMAGITICTATGDSGSSDIPNIDFPSSSPYSCACGGTSLVCPTLKYDGAGTVETVWAGSGGGISLKFSKPSWQHSVTATGRSIPDIASNADPDTGVIFYVGGKNGKIHQYGGTSIAAPTLAAYFACSNVNTFITPKLYLAPNASFNDITTGSNGFYNASTGYDNCTGKGSIVGNILNSHLN